MEDMNLFCNKCKFDDFSNCEINDDYDLNGVTPKFVITDNGKDYILKFQKNKGNIVIKDYVSEFISCKLAKALGYSVQEVELGFYNNKECVRMQMLPYNIITFTGFGPSTDSYFFEYDLDSLLTLPFNKEKFALTVEEFEDYVWSVFVLDMLVGNFDRHENNWGFYKKDSLYYPAALYDLGSSFYPWFLGQTPEFNKKSLRHLIEFDTRCAILYHGKRKNYFELLQLHEDNELLYKNLMRILDKDPLQKIQPILKEVYAFNSEYKAYLQFVYDVLKERITMLGEIIK